MALVHMNVAAAVRADGQPERADKLEVRGGFVLRVKKTKLKSPRLA